MACRAVSQRLIRSYTNTRGDCISAWTSFSWCFPSSEFVFGHFIINSFVLCETPVTFLLMFRIMFHIGNNKIGHLDYFFFLFFSFLEHDLSVNTTLAKRFSSLLTRVHGTVTHVGHVTVDWAEVSLSTSACQRAISHPVCRVQTFHV